jgi:hypothetical protein
MHEKAQIRTLRMARIRCGRVHVSEDINHILGSIFHNTVENNIIDPVKIVRISKVGSW